jgi:hypothetical protein
MILSNLIEGIIGGEIGGGRHILISNGKVSSTLRHKFSPFFTSYISQSYNNPKKSIGS